MSMNHLQSPKILTTNVDNVLRKFLIFTERLGSVIPSTGQLMETKSGVEYVLPMERDVPLVTIPASVMSDCAWDIVLVNTTPL
jgi:hypothetical protein